MPTAAASYCSYDAVGALDGTRGQIAVRAQAAGSHASVPPFSSKRAISPSALGLRRLSLHDQLPKLATWSMEHC
jgi:hypothetical protein